MNKKGVYVMTTEFIQNFAISVLIVLIGLTFSVAVFIRLYRYGTELHNQLKDVLKDDEFDDIEEIKEPDEDETVSNDTRDTGDHMEDPNLQQEESRET